MNGQVHNQDTVSFVKNPPVILYTLWTVHRDTYMWERPTWHTLFVINLFQLNYPLHFFFYVFLTVHHSIGLFLQPTLMHNSITTCMSHYYPRHVSGLDSPLSTGVVYSRLGERGYQMLCLCSCSSWRWACQGPKHVEDNVTYMFILKCALKLVLKK